MEMTILCMGFFLFGIFAGRKFAIKEKIFKYLEKTLFVLVILLVFLIGTMIGIDEKVISSLGSIGVTSFVLAVFTMAGSAAGITVLRRLLKIDRRGVHND